MASKAIAPRADYLGYGLGAIMAFVLAFVVGSFSVHIILLNIIFWRINFI